MAERGSALLRELTLSHEAANAEADRARRDPLTGLLRHAYFRQRVDFEVGRSARTGEPLALLLLDLDRFELFNRERGWEEGERALATLGRALEMSVRSAAAPRPPVLGRESGNRFGVLLPAAHVTDVEATAEQLRSSVERMPIGPPRLTCSVGAVLLSTISSPTRTFIVDVAARALRRAKEDGGNRSYVTREPESSCPPTT